MGNNSPKPKTPAHTLELSFKECIGALLDGESITKKEWGSKEYFGKIVDGKLSLYKPDGKVYNWVLTDGDLEGEDYYII